MTDRRRLNEWPEWPTARDWIGIGTFGLTVMILWMVKADASLRTNEFFKNISLLIIGTGFINGAVAWAYSSTKTGSELAERNASIVQGNVEKKGDEPQPVKVTNEATDPVPTTDAPAAAALAQQMKRDAAADKAADGT